MPPSSKFFNLIRQKPAVSIIVVVAVLALVWLIYSRSATPSSEEKTAAQQVAEEVAKVENPFKVGNPLSTIETNPFEKAKKVLNPFEQ